MPDARPLIPEAQSQDWTTPEPPLEFAYDTLGCPVGLDPASNARSIVKAKRTIWWDQLRDDELELPPGVEWGDGLEVLKEVEPGTTVYLNPPFGREELPRWVEACAAAFARGVEIIALLPSYTSSYWFDEVSLTATKACFWGLPGETTSRLRFSDSQHGAGYAVMFVYWGRYPERFVRTWARAGQIWHIDRDRVLTAIICGLRITGMPGQNPSAGDLFVHAERQVILSRYEALLGACTGIMDHTIGDLMSSGAEGLKDQFSQLTIGEVLSGLALAATADVENRTVRRSRAVNRRALASQPDTQLSMHQYARRSVAEIREFDKLVLGHISEQGNRGSTRAELTAALLSSTSKVRESIRRLRKSGAIRLKGNKRTARYTTKEHQEGPQNETQEE